MAPFVCLSGLQLQTGAATFIAWVNLVSVTYWGRIMDIRVGQASAPCAQANNSGERITLTLLGISAGLHFDMSGYSMDSSEYFTLGQWTHVAITISASGLWTMYRNGQKLLMYGGVPMQSTFAVPLFSAFVGRSNYPGEPCPNHYISQFAYYSYELDAATVNGLAAGVLPPPSLQPPFPLATSWTRIGTFSARSGQALTVSSPIPFNMLKLDLPPGCPTGSCQCDCPRSSCTFFPANPGSSPCTNYISCAAYPWTQDCRVEGVVLDTPTARYVLTKADSGHPWLSWWPTNQQEMVEWKGIAGLFDVPIGRAGLTPDFYTIRFGDLEAAIGYSEFDNWGTFTADIYVANARAAG